MGKIGKVIRKRLGKRNAHGLIEEDSNDIYIDPKCKGIKELEILIHEASHLLCDYLTEETIEEIGCELARLLWSEGFRKVDNDTSQKLQDEK